MFISTIKIEMKLVWVVIFASFQNEILALKSAICTHDALVGIELIAMRTHGNDHCFLFPINHDAITTTTGRNPFWTLVIVSLLSKIVPHVLCKDEWQHLSKRIYATPYV
jgi:hypothetical protein